MLVLITQTNRSTIIPFHRGETWTDKHNQDRRNGDGTERRFVLPPHVFFLGVVDEWQDENYLLLDTTRGNIVEVQKPYGERTMTIPDEEYDNLADDRLWTGHRSVAAAEFFGHWKQRMQQLLTMPVPPSTSETDNVPKFYQRAVNGTQNVSPPRSEQDWQPHFDDEWYDEDLETDEGEADEPEIEALQLEPVDMTRPASVSVAHDILFALSCLAR